MEMQYASQYLMYTRVMCLDCVGVCERVSCSNIVVFSYEVYARITLHVFLHFHVSAY